MFPIKIDCVSIAWKCFGNIPLPLTWDPLVGPLIGLSLGGGGGPRAPGPTPLG